MQAVPHFTTLAAMVARFDIANMLYHRWWHDRSRPALRYLAYDASPKQGTELFATVERVLLRCHLVRHEEGGVLPIL